MIHLVGTRLALEIGGREPAAPQLPWSADGSPGARELDVGSLGKMRARSSDTVIASIAAQPGGGLLPRLALARIVAESSSCWESVR